MANITEHLQKIITAIFGRDVRQSLHDGLKLINEETEGTTTKQKQLERQFNGLIINAGSSNAEIVSGRTKADGTQFDTIGKRLDASDSQLDNITNEQNNNSFYYMQTFHRNDEKLYIYTSNDALNFTCINRKFPITIDGTNVRDPHILEKNGVFYLVKTEDTNGFNIYKSYNLIDWNSIHRITTTANYGTWAPEFFEYNNKLYIIVTLINGTDANMYDNCYMYITECQSDDLLNWSTLNKIQINNNNNNNSGVNVIDGSLIEYNNKFYMCYVLTKQQNPYLHNIAIASSDTINGPYETLTNFDYNLHHRVEGCSFLKLEDGTIRMFMDYYNQGVIKYIDTKDFVNFTEAKTIDLDATVKHFKVNKTSLNTTINQLNQISKNVNTNINKLSIINETGEREIVPHFDEIDFKIYPKDTVSNYSAPCRLVEYKTKNLLINGNGEYGAEYWTKTNGTFYYDYIEKAFYLDGLAMTNYTLPPVHHIKDNYQPYNVYTLSFEAKSINPSGNNGLYVNIFDDKTNITGAVGKCLGVTQVLTNGYTKYTFDFTPTSNNISLEFGRYSGSKSHIKEIMIVKQQVNNIDYISSKFDYVSIPKLHKIDSEFNYINKGVMNSYITLTYLNNSTRYSTADTTNYYAYTSSITSWLLNCKVISDINKNFIYTKCTTLAEFTTTDGLCYFYETPNKLYLKAAKTEISDPSQNSSFDGYNTKYKIGYLSYREVGSINKICKNNFEFTNHNVFCLEPIIEINLTQESTTLEYPALVIGGYACIVEVWDTEKNILIDKTNIIISADGTTATINKFDVYKNLKLVYKHAFDVDVECDFIFKNN